MAQMRRREMDAVGREQLTLREAAIPRPGPGEVLVRVAAVALSYRDKMVVENGRDLPLAFPFTPGSDLAGTVAALMLKDITIHGIATGHRRALTRLVDAVDRTGLTPTVDTRYPLTELHAALDHLDRG